MAPTAERSVALPPLLRGAAMSDASHFRHGAARANRLAAAFFDALTQERLKALATDYLKQAIELERGGPTAPPDGDPAE